MGVAPPPEMVPPVASTQTTGRAPGVSWAVTPTPQKLQSAIEIASATKRTAHGYELSVLIGES